MKITCSKCGAAYDVTQSGKYQCECGEMLVVSSLPAMKKCPACGEEVLANAQKCKHCGEWFERPKFERSVVSKCFYYTGVLASVVFFLSIAALIVGLVARSEALMQIAALAIPGFLISLPCLGISTLIDMVHETSYNTRWY